MPNPKIRVPPLELDVEQFSLSIMGTARFSSRYGVAKAAHEKALLAGPIPVRILRAAQFHEFVD